nr:MAG TPA: hypothetical protein [Bacteriophage sp.]
MASQFGLRVGNNIRNYRLAKGMSMREHKKGGNYHG